MKKPGILKLFIFLLASLLMSFNAAQAQESYRFEAGGLYHTTDDDDDMEIKVYGIGGIFHFSEVNTSDHPRAEAAFLERVGSVEIQAGTGSIEGNGLEGDITRIIAELEYMQPDSPLYVAALVDKMELDFDPPLVGGMDMDGLGIGVGYFIDEGLRVSAGYITEEESFDITAPIFVKSTTDYDTFFIEGKMVKKLDDGKAFNAEVGLSHKKYDDQSTDGTNHALSLSGDYYFNRNFSLGAGLEINSGDDKSAEGDTMTLNVNNFFTPQFYVNVELAKFNADDDVQGTDEDSFDLFFAYRF